MRPHVQSLVALVAASTVASMSAFASVPPKPPKPPILVKLDIDSPQFNPRLPLGLMYSSGWPLEFKATVLRDDSGNRPGIVARQAATTYPGNRQTAWIVFEDPDDCLEVYWEPGDFDVVLPECLQGATDVVPDETYLEFSMDFDNAGMSDPLAPNGDPVRLGNLKAWERLSDPTLSGRPKFLSQNDNDIASGLPPSLEEFGPRTGDAVKDGYGFGADDDFINLVVLARHGAGIVFDQDFNRPAGPLRQRNLAGFMNWVNYELTAANGLTVVHAGMTVPYGLVAPLVKLDLCAAGGGVTSEPNCVVAGSGGTQGGLYRLDGGPLVSRSPLTDGQTAFDEVMESLTYVVRAFLVNGLAPSELSDLDGDGRVTAEDARLAGYDVISNEETIRLRQVSGFQCGGEPFTNLIPFDFDGNGAVRTDIACPPGPGAIKPPPK